MGYTTGQTTDTRPADYIRHRLVRFSDAIDETRRHYRDLSAFGRYYAAAPYYEKSGILLLLDGLKSDPGTREELCAEFRQGLRKLESLEDELGAEYLAQLRRDLHHYADVYAAAVCHEQVGNVRFETDHDLFQRDLILVLMHELGRDHDFAGLEDLIGMLDRNLFVPKGSGDLPVTGTSLQVSGRPPGNSDQSPAGD